MNQPIHIQNFKISLNKIILDQFLDSESIQMKSSVEMIEGEATISPKRLNWTFPEDQTAKIKTVIDIQVQNQDWAFTSQPHLHIFPHRNPTPFQWDEVDEDLIPGFRLGDRSAFQIDGHPIQLTPTLNNLLLNQKEAVIKAIKENLITQITKISNQYLGNDLLANILKSYYFRIALDGTDQKLISSLSISSDNVHSDQFFDDRSQIKIDLPEENLFHLLRQVPFPTISAMGYNLRVAKVEPTDVNKLEIRLVDSAKQLQIDLTTKVLLLDNVIRLKILDLDIHGINWLKSGIFKMLKTTIIRKIEKRKIPISNLYHSMIFELTKKYPFLQIQENQELDVRQLKISPDGLSVTIHFTPHIAD